MGEAGTTPADLLHYAVAGMAALCAVGVARGVEQSGSSSGS